MKSSLEKVAREEKEEREERRLSQRRPLNHDHPRLVFSSLSVVFIVSLRAPYNKVNV